MLKKYKSNMTAPLLMCIVYLLLILSRITEVGRVGGESEYVGTIVLQLIIFLFPTVIYAKLKGEGYSSRLKIRLVGAHQLLVALLGALTLICGSLLLNILIGEGVGQSDFSLYDTFVAEHDGSAESFFYVTLAYAVLPAVCEEFFFSGLMCAEYEEHGMAAAVIMPSLFFGMVHLNFAQLAIYIFAGLVLAAVMYATRSILGSILVHFVYNLYGLFGQSFANELYRTTGSTELFMLILSAAFILFLALFALRKTRPVQKGSRYLCRPSDLGGGYIRYS